MSGAEYYEWYRSIFTSNTITTSNIFQYFLSAIWGITFLKKLETKESYIYACPCRTAIPFKNTYLSACTLHSADHSAYTSSKFFLKNKFWLQWTVYHCADNDQFKIFWPLCWPQQPVEYLQAENPTFAGCSIDTTCKSWVFRLYVKIGSL